MPQNRDNLAKKTDLCLLRKHVMLINNITPLACQVVSRLCTCLEDIQGQFPQLHTLEEAVLDLDDMCRVGSGGF